MTLIDETLLVDEPAAAVQIPTELLLKLRVPVHFANVEYAELRLSEPTGKELAQAERADTDIGRLLVLIHMNAKVPLGAVEHIRQRDAQDAARFYETFGNRPQAIAQPSA